jgi:hypothetical protein
MAITQNTYTGNGSTVLFSFTFPYLETTDIKVSLNGSPTTAYTLANATTVQFNTAPANGVAVRIYRETNDSSLSATFYPGSAIRSQDLNDNFTQNLYVTQESNNNASASLATINIANATASTALANSNTAISTANSAVATANGAVTTANSATTSAANAVTTANAASSTATSSLNLSNSTNNRVDQLYAAVADAILYDLVANVAAIPASPANNDAVEVVNSTGIENFTPLAGRPAGFVGSSGLSVRIVYSTPGSTWNWVQYFPNDPETRYLRIATASSTYLTQANATSTYQPLSGMSSYLTTANASSTYLTQANATANLQSKADMAKYATLAQSYFFSSF